MGSCVHWVRKDGTHDRVKREINLPGPIRDGSGLTEPLDRM